MLTMLHDPVRRLRDVQRPQEVERQHPLRKAGRRGCGVGFGRAAGIVDDKVEPPVACEDALDHRLHRVGVAHVARFIFADRAIVRRQLGGRIASADRDRETVGEQALGYRKTDTLAAPRDKRHAPISVRHICLHRWADLSAPARRKSPPIWRYRIRRQSP